MAFLLKKLAMLKVYYLMVNQLTQDVIATQNELWLTIASLPLLLSHILLHLQSLQIAGLSDTRSANLRRFFSVENRFAIFTSEKASIDFISFVF